MIDGSGNTASFAQRARFSLGVVLVFLLTLAVYSPALRGQFVWDDALLVHKNPLLTKELTLRSVWFGTDFPLTIVAFWVQWLAWGKNAAGYHAVNILLHATSAVLVWRILAKLKIPGAFLAALIFTVHPVCVGSVAWISELKNTLSLPLYLLSIWWYLRNEDMSQESEGSGQKAEGGAEAADGQCQTPAPRPSHFTLHTSYFLSLIAFTLALLSKTSTVMLPVVLLGLVWWQRGRITRRDWLRCLPYFGLALAFGLLTVWFQYQQTIGRLTVQTQTFWGKLAGAAMAIWFYLGKALLPLKLTMIYPIWSINERAPSSYLPLLLLFLGFGVCWVFRRTWGRPPLFGLGYFVVTLFPVLGFFDMYFMSMSRVSDHFQYLPLIGVVALGAAALTSAFQSVVSRPWPWWRRGIGYLPAMALLAFFSLLATQRARVMASDETLWRDTLEKNPTAWNAHNNLACILAEKKDYDAAIPHFIASLESNPLNAAAHFNLARALVLKGRFAEAGTHFREALAITPSANMSLDYARLLMQTGKIKEAIGQYRQALSEKPDSTEALNNLGWLLATAPDATMRDGREAVRVAEHACRLTEYKEATPVGTLAVAYAEAGRFTEAVAMGEKAIQLATDAGNAGFAQINRQLLAYYRAGKPWHQAPAQPTGRK